jgi:hypothetical protein
LKQTVLPCLKNDIKKLEMQFQLLFMLMDYWAEELDTALSAADWMTLT